MKIHYVQNVDTVLRGRVVPQSFRPFRGYSWQVSLWGHDSFGNMWAWTFCSLPHSGPCTQRTCWVQWWIQEPIMNPGAHCECRNPSWMQEPIVNSGTHREAKNPSWIQETIVNPEIHRESRNPSRIHYFFNHTFLSRPPRPPPSPSSLAPIGFWQHVMCRIRLFEIHLLAVFLPLQCEQPLEIWQS